MRNSTPPVAQPAHRERSVPSGERGAFGAARRTAAVMMAVVVALLAAPSAAPAATSCQFAFGVLRVEMSDSADRAILAVAPDGEIVVIGNGGQVTCAGAANLPRVTNTDAILVRNVPGAANNFVSIQEATRFAPGASREGENGGDREIEITVNLNDRPGSAVFVSTDEALGGSLRFGTDGVNPNATASEVAPDADVLLQNVPAGSLVGIGNNAADVLGAQGGAGTGDARSDRVSLQAGGGADRLTGGAGGDNISAGGGSDELTGAGGDDFLDPGSGQDNDNLDGGPGTDVATYVSSGTVVSVDLAIAGPQPTGAGADSLVGVENLVGTPFADVLRGDGGPNQLHGVQGVDLLEGRGGQDALEGGPDADRLEARDGGPDRADCGDGTDTVATDLPGIDTLVGCENVLFPLVVGGGATGGGPAAAGGGSADTLAPFFRGRPRAVPARFRVRRRTGRATAIGSVPRGTSFHYSLSEPATVTFTIERRTRGHLAGGRCRHNTSWPNASKRGCVLMTRSGAFRAQARVGDNRTRFSGRIGKRALKAG
jgi:RTX calcium-binding nonapeptide repeat (4 copies)